MTYSIRFPAGFIIPTINGVPCDVTKEFLAAGIKATLGMK